MKLVIIHAHSENRGDEAAVKAMTDSLLKRYPNAEITIFMNGRSIYPNFHEVKQYGRMPKIHSILSKLDFWLILVSRARLSFTSHGKCFISSIKESDMVIHAPGGPSIGDMYYKDEKLYLDRLSIVQYLKKPYVFYAPSMGPFSMNNSHRNAKRKLILEGASRIILRDPISVDYLNGFLPNLHTELVCDSALQSDIDDIICKRILNEDQKLSGFLSNHNKCVGITITDLKWHPKYINSNIEMKIKESFTEFISWLTHKGYGILFIPQQYGSGDDYSLMEKYAKSDNCYIMSPKMDKQDSIFQQYIIKNLYAMIGMRYHGNIFSVKGATPCIAISYEQKTVGFMKMIECEEYCVDIGELSFAKLKDKFCLLEENYSKYKSYLFNIHDNLKKKAYRASEIVFELLESK